MRLIDADKLPIYSTIEGVEKSEKGTVAILGNWVSAISIEEAPTVKAIPIEWIERWLDRVTGTKDGDDISKYHDIVKGGILFINMLERDWEKENEAD